MSPHGGALWPREKAGHGGAGLHLSMGILFSKSCQRSPGISVGQLTVVIAGEETKAGLKHAVFRREKNLCVSQARHSGSLHRSLLQSAFNRRRRQQTGSRRAGVHADRRSQQEAPTEPSTLGWAQHKKTCLWKVTLRWMSLLSEPWWVHEWRCN